MDENCEVGLERIDYHKGTVSHGSWTSNFFKKKQFTSRQN